jgi:hypothetical protein
VTGRATFGDFMRATARYLDTPADLPRAVGRSRQAAAMTRQVREASDGLLRVISVMTRYVADSNTAFADVPAGDRHLLSAWARASIEAQEALGNAAAFLRECGANQDAPHETPQTPLARRLHAVAASLATGRDLLHTHFALGADGVRRDHSDWAPVITSGRMTHALLGELAFCAGKVALQGAELALSRAPVQRGTGADRWRLNAACQWLWVMDAAVQAAQRQDPVPPDDRQLLYAIPVNARPPRPIARGGEPVSALCNGVIVAAERVRHAARPLPAQATWSPAMTSTSCRLSAAAAAAVSQNCEILLRSLAARAAQHGSRGTSAQLVESADAAARASASWLRAAHGWDLVTTDTRGYLSQAAADMKDLARWTERFAYTEPAETTSGPSRATRSPADLAPQSGDIPIVVAAVHHACEALTRLADAESGQIEAAGRAGRLLVPTRSLPDTFDIPRPFAQAPPDRIDSLLFTYRDVGTASAGATAKVATVAETVSAHSRILTAAKNAVNASREGSAANARNHRPEPVMTNDRRHHPGPVERVLYDLGVTSPALLQRGSAIDQASQQLITDAAETLSLRQARPIEELSRSPGTAELINHVLASADSRATAQLRPPTHPQAEAEPPQAEP